MYGIEEIYDIIHQDKNYLSESAVISSIIDQNISNSDIDLLDVACGSGSHLLCLKDKYKCVGIDINKKLIEIAQKKQIESYCLDMRQFELNKKFDVITCLFGSIAHLENYQQLCETIKNLKNHLKNSGIILIEPWLFLEQYTPRTASRFISDSVWVESRNTIEGNIAILDKTYKVQEKEYKCKIEICCFTKEQYFSAAKEAGLNVTIIDHQLETNFSNGILLFK
jgi:SAM-dependent methyltransferase